MDTTTAPQTQEVITPEVRVPLWLKKGKIVSGAMSTSEAIVKAGLDFTVEKTPMFAQYKEADGSATAVPITDQVAVMRTDTHKVLGYVGENYGLVQNIEAFNFFDHIVQGGQAQIEVAGVKGDGEKLYILAKMPKDTMVGDDVVQNYILMVNTHDGSSTIRIALTPVRPVCFNALSLALKRSELEFRVHHRMSVHDKLLQAQNLMQTLSQHQEQTSQIFNAMATKLVDPVMLKGYLDSIFPINEKDATKKDPLKKHRDGSSRTKNIRNEVTRLFQEGRGNKGRSLWDLYNGLTEYSDHYRVVKGESDRWEVAAFGSGVNLKQRAFQSAVALLPEYSHLVLAA